ncbi:MAG: RHS repeat-associated core domain-containing protein, partial [Ferruginibacter sp.]
GRIQSTSIDGSKMADFEYNEALQLSDINLGNNLKTNLQYDFGNRLSSVITDNNLAPNYTIGYNNLMLKTQRNKFNNPDSTEHYVFDDNQRLMSFKKGNLASPSINLSYQYDGVGNRISFSKNGLNTNNTFNNVIQLTSTSTGASTINYTYDNRGNLSFDGKFFKTYDSENRLVKDSSSPSTVIVYQYDAFGRRVKRIENNQGFTLTYDGLKPIEQRNFPTDTLMLSNFFSLGSSPTMMMKPNMQRYYYHKDDLGSVASITNGNGALVEKYFYSPFGEQIIFNSNNNQIALSEIGNRYGFTGKEYDATTKSNHFMYREYDPATGRFFQRDPLGYKDGSGLYNYVKNNPVNYTDPYGLQLLSDENASEAGNIGGNAGFIADEYNGYNQKSNSYELEYLQKKSTELSKGSKGQYRGLEKRGEIKIKTNLRIKYLEEVLERNAKNIKNISKWANRLSYLDIAWKIYLYSKYKSECPGSDDDLLKQSIYFKDIMVSTVGLAGSGGLINLADYGIEKIFGMSATTAITTVTFHTNNFADRMLTFDGVNYNPYSAIPTA